MLTRIDEVEILVVVISSTKCLVSPTWNLGPLYTVVSKKVSSSVLCSCVNFMVWCTLLIFSMKVSRALSVSVHTMKISSMNLFHISMALLFNLISLGSSSPMNRLA